MSEEEIWKMKMTEPDEKIIEVEIERLRDFWNHPFKVKDDKEMDLLVKSIEKYGILSPLIVRPKLEGCYEIISGHRRKHAAKKLGYRKVPVIIRVLDNEEAVVCMVDSNCQRENIAPSEKAFAYRMKYNAIKRVGHRIKKSSQNGDPYRGMRSVEVVGKIMGDSSKQVQRYLKLTELIPDLLEKLDNGELAFNPAYELAFLDKENQVMMLDAMEYTQAAPSLSQAQRIKALGQKKELRHSDIIRILEEIKQGQPERVIFKTEQLREYFPRNYTVDMMKEGITRLLKESKETRIDNKGENKHV